MIDSAANPIVKALHALKTAKARRERRQFLVEGVRGVEEGLMAGAWPDVALYNAALLQRTARGAALLDKLLRPHGARDKAHIIGATERAIVAASETLHPQGIVAAFHFVEWPDPPASVEMPLALICDDIQDPGNLGTLLRSAEAAGVSAVWLTPLSVDLYNPKVVRGAMGAHFRLPVYAERTIQQIRSDLKRVGVPLECIHATEATAQVSYDQINWTRPAALIISNEAHGITPAARSLAANGAFLTIPMAGGAESLNAAMAGAIILFEAARQRRDSYQARS
ncbi:MAG: RNA methyltransferase [Chloroflexi bacterium]|nr:RNA methyltransferase [Chloroflexota bacterium]